MANMNIDLGNTRTLTILAIVCILVFACIYVMVIRGNNLEGFAESVLAKGDTVRLVDGLKSVILGSGTSGGNANDYINSIMPAMSVIAYAGDTAPAGWQICDGSRLKYTNGDPVLTANGNDFINTPNLKGRVIVGVNPTADTANGLSVRNKGDTGGEEKHLLTIPEMPEHNHQASIAIWGAKFFNSYEGSKKAGLITGYWKPGVHQDSGVYEDVDVNNTKYIAPSGNSLAHNNMQPFFVLNYIIKQPVKP